MTPYARQRRILIGEAGSALYDAIIAFTTRTGGLTGPEWLQVYSDLNVRMVGDVLLESWEEDEREKQQPREAAGAKE